MKYVLITGASTGIGFTCAQHLIQQGFFVFGSVRKQADVDRLERDLGVNFKALQFDVVDGEAIKKSVLEVEKIVGENGLTALINNAGIAVSGPIQHVPVDQLEYQLNVNVLGVVRVTQAFLPLLGGSLESDIPPGRILQMSSVSGKIAAPFLGPYSASKFALEAISDSLRRELTLYGIKVIVIQPGPIKTPIWGKALIQDGKQYANTDYSDILIKRDRSIQKTEENAIPPEQVAKVVYKSIVAKNPKTRYIVAKKGWQYKLYNMLPDRILDNASTKPIKKYLKNKN